MNMEHGTEQISLRAVRKSYRELLKDQRWIELSAKIKSERGNCELCSSSENLQVHHCGYRAEMLPWDYDKAELMLVCARCHKGIHRAAEGLWNAALGIPSWACVEILQLVTEMAFMDEPSQERVLSDIRHMKEAEHAKSFADYVREAGVRFPPPESFTAQDPEGFDPLEDD